MSRVNAKSAAAKGSATQKANKRSWDEEETQLGDKREERLSVTQGESRQQRERRRGKDSVSLLFRDEFRFAFLFFRCAARTSRKQHLLLSLICCLSNFPEEK